MIKLIIIGALLCPQTKVLNLTDEWNDRDIEAQAMATVGCAKQYGEEYACLKLFTKMEPLVYRAICGSSD